MRTASAECRTSLNDSRSVLHGAVSTAAAAGLALVDPRDLGAGRLWAFRAANAAFAGWMTWAVMTTEATDTSRGVRTGIVVGAVSLTLAGSRWSEGIDARMHDGLLHYGVKQPRVVFALCNAAIGAASWWRARQPGPSSGSRGDQLGQVGGVGEPHGST